MFVVYAVMVIFFHVRRKMIQAKYKAKEIRRLSWEKTAYRFSGIAKGIQNAHFAKVSFFFGAESGSLVPKDNLHLT